MRMSDVMSHMDLAVYPILGMMLFLSVFVGVVLQVTRRDRRTELDGAALLPFADTPTTPTRTTTPITPITPTTSTTEVQR